MEFIDSHCCEREKLHYIRNKKKAPAESDDEYEKWYAKNQKVKRWLFMSDSRNHEMLRTHSHGSRHLGCYPAFYDENDEFQVFSLNKKPFAAKQSGKSLSLYYGELTKIFRGLDHRDKVVMKNPDDVEAY